MKKAFTLAEVLITLAIIGVVAAISIPSVVVNTQQKEFQTGLRKAVSVLNSAITMNMALDGESPYENKTLFYYLQRHMSVMRSYTSDDPSAFHVSSPIGGDWNNSGFYTTDGMRFEFWAIDCTKGYKTPDDATYWDKRFPLYENNYSYNNLSAVCGCGSYGLPNNTDNTMRMPCIVTVDVNGDRKPNPSNVDCHSYACATPYKYPDPTGKKLTDIFSIMITDKQAIPYGVAAQRAMYEAQKGK